MFVSVIIPAAGFGERMGAAIAKQFLMLEGKPIFVRTLERFQHCEVVNEIIVATQYSSFALINELRENYNLTKVKNPVEGGETRQISIANALEVVDHLCDIVSVHDAVRPFVKNNEIIQSIETAKFYGASILAVRAKDTIKQAATDGRVEKTLNRSSLWLAQTPQTFKKEILLEAYLQAKKDKIIATDDSLLVERIGISPIIVEGSYENIKITTPDDLLLAELLLQRFVP